MIHFPDDYFKACQKIKRAEDTSDIQTDDIESGERKRKRIKPQRLYSSSSEHDETSEEMFERPPRINLNASRSYAC